MNVAKKTLEELQEESKAIQKELEKFWGRHDGMTKAEMDECQALRRRSSIITTALMKCEQEAFEAKRKAFAERSDIKDIRMLLESAIMKMKMPVYYSRCEADSDFSLLIKSAKNIECGGYALDELGKKTTLSRISLSDLAGIVECGEEQNKVTVEEDEV